MATFQRLSPQLQTPLKNMKVSPLPQSNPDSFISALEASSPMHNSTLKFIDDSLEEAYQKYIREKATPDTTHHPSVKSRYVTFSLLYFSSLGLILLVHIIDHLVTTSGGQTVIGTQIALIVSLFSFGLVIVMLTYFFSDQRRAAVMSFILLYFATGVGVTFSDKSVLMSYARADEPEPHFSVLVTIVVLTLALEGIIYYDFIIFCLCSAAVSLLFLAISLTGSRSPHVVVFEFLFLLVYTLGSTRRLYQSEKMSRKIFYLETADRDMRLLRHSSSGAKSAAPSQTPQPAEISYNTELENIVNLIHSSITIIGEATKIVIYEDLRGRLKQALQNLTIAGSKLKAGPHIFEAKVEALNPDIDEEDKQFVKETCTMPQPEISGEYQGQRVVERKCVDLKLTCEFSEVMAVLNQMGKSWNFDTFFLQECTSGKALSISGRYFLSSFNLMEKFLIPENVTIKYFEHMEENYRPNPYHNSCHAADVLNSTLFLAKSSVLLSYMSDIEILALVVATLGHDVGHQALNNRFLVNNRDQLAITYNDTSVLENMHASFTFAIMQDESMNLFKYLDGEKWILARKIIIKMILATDMSRHFELLGQFNAVHTNAQTTMLSKLEERINVLEIAIKCGDIGHAGKTLELHERWTLLVCEEFFHQGDLEKGLGLPVSMYCDKETTDISKSQSGFIAHIVLPLFLTLNSFLDATAIETNCIAQLRSNKEHWDTKHIKKRRNTIKGKVSETDVKNEFQALKEKLRSWKRGGTYKTKKTDGEHGMV